MLRLLSLLILSVCPLLSFGASAFLSSTILHKGSLPCGAVLSMHTLLYGGILIYASMIGSMLIEAHRYREPTLSIELVYIKYFFFFLCLSCTCSVVDMLCLSHLRLFRYLLVWALLVMLDVLYLLCVSDIQKGMTLKHEHVLEGLEDSSSDTSSSSSTRARIKTSTSIHICPDAHTNTLSHTSTSLSPGAHSTAQIPNE
ncbi:hypothetical protein NECID01_0221 [Nematocida sp. AWRm77]|nr:hypothetical protein NECID01_0221 [Nematocida sp. AWRm77]